MDTDTAQVSRHYCLELERLVEVVQQLSLARDMDRIGEIVRHEARELTGADGASFVLREGTSCYYADEEAIGPLWKGRRLPMDRCVSGWAMAHGETVGIEDVRSDARSSAEAAEPSFVRSLLMVPVRRTEPVGAIGSYWAHTHRPTGEEVHLLQALADTAALAIENVRLRSDLEQRVKERTEELEREVAERRHAEEAVRQMAISDEQTGLLNRRGFFLQAAQQWKVAQRMGQKGLLLFVDLDGLKHVNDTLGHEVGDRMILDAAELLRTVFRRSDVVARIGGDEFAVFTLDARDPAALRQRLRRSVDALNDDAARPYRLSLSVGLSGHSPGAPDSLEQMLEQADAAMYHEKRNKVVSRAFAD
jgi:diguanylate cyclase (GGDEF)-like protein